MNNTKVFSAVEELLTAIVQNGVDLIGIIDEQMVYKYTSPSVKRILGYEEDYLLHKPASNFIHPDDLQYVNEQFEKVLAGREIEIINFRFKHNNGTWRWIETIATNLLTNPVINGIVVNSRDITERKEKESERELLIVELTRSNNDLKQFSFITSHNLRAPLSNIQGLVSLIDPNKLDKNTEEIFQLIKTSTLRLTHTINDITKILLLKNNASISMNLVDIESMFYEVNKIFFAENKFYASIITDFQVQKVYFNSVYLESIFTNLISNAIKYRSPNRTLVIKVSTFSCEKGDVVLEFSDNGLGIDLTRHKNRIFGMYQRFHSNTEGTGLGLFIIKTQVEALRGTIAIESEINKGTAFYISIPKSKPSA